MVEILAASGLTLVSEGSIYPLLTRLERGGRIESYRERSAAGPPRKYYRLTPEGAADLVAGRQTWHAFAAAVGQVLADPPALGADPDSVATTSKEHS
jgi:PadR family transcriptional regulator PadR